MEDNFTKKTFFLLTDKNINGWKRFGTMILRLFILVIFIILTLYLFSYLFPRAGVEKVEALGNTIFFKTQDKELYYYLFPTSDIWADPGIDFDIGDKIKITVSGKYYPAIHHLVDYSKSDTNRIFKWIGPEGIPFNLLLRKADRLRYLGRPQKDANYGALLVKLKKSGAKDSTIYFFERNPLKFSFKDFSGSLEFCVNEPILDITEKSHDLYLITKAEDEKYDRSEDEQNIAWEKMKKEGTTRNLWFDDNIGELFILIEKETSR